ncbi:NUDIX hydrolase [Streptomyces sp. NPDC048442]|uniref:NUDIX hydrolase n=1 Tax=Streptomyces sp. NPDC048442 TaxID=3154823 RepID=UPI00341FFEF5
MAHSDTDYAHTGHRRIGALLLIRNESGNVLLVSPSYKEGDQLVGGGAKPGETPHEAAYREGVEEIGLHGLTVGGLLLVDYIAANADTGAVEGYNFVFDGGVIPDTPRITLPVGLPGQEPELTGWSFCPPAALDEFCRPYQARRIRAALAALDDASQRGLRIEGRPA